MPDGATELARNTVGPQAFRLRRNLAVQFHPEVDDAIHEDWLNAWGDELPEYGLTAEQLRAQRAEYGPQMQAASARLLGEYLEGLARRAESAA